jgi:dTDP-4-amino-4,6-dideoxygalactose transaminase
MEQDLSRGERSERTSRERTDQQEERAASNEEAFDRREKLHLGSNFHVIGDLKNTDIVMNDTFWIGVWPGLTKPMLDYVIESIHLILGKK